MRSIRTGLLRLLSLLPLALLWGCSPEHAGVFQGYIEGEYVYVAAPMAGTLQALAVERGDPVEPGQLLFALDPEPEAAAVREAMERLSQAELQLADQAKGLRPSELAALEARLASARADAEFAQSELARFDQLREERVISPDEMDRARTRRDASLATVARLTAELETGRLGAREDQIAAGEREVGAREAALSRARWALEQKQQRAQTNGVVEDTLYREGEWVAAGRPVVSLLPPLNVKVRFFIPEPELASFHPGETVWVSYDEAPGPLAATVRFISTQAEFTPPVLYSRENRAKLVYMIEAAFTPEDAAGLRPGQPVDVRRER